MSYIGLLLVFLGGIVLTIGDIIFKKWVINNETLYYLVGMFTYMVGMNFLVLSFRYKNIAVASMLFVIFNIVTLALVSWLYFKEPLSTRQLIGIGVGIIAVLILESE